MLSNLNFEHGSSTHAHKMFRRGSHLHKRRIIDVFQYCPITQQQQLITGLVCVCVRGIVGEKQGKREIEVVSGLSQLGITVKARFVGALKRGICNFPLLVCTAVRNS